MSTTAETVRRAVEVSKRLNEVTDQLNTSLARAEKGLTDLQLGVSAGVPLDLGAGATPHVLSFEKQATWCLVVRRVGDGEYYSPVLKAARHMRIAAANALPALLDALIAVVLAQESRAVEALSRCNQALEDIER